MKSRAHASTIPKNSWDSFWSRTKKSIIVDSLRFLAVFTHFIVGKKFFDKGFVLEVGCGRAYASKLLMDGRGVLVGLDFSIAALEKAKQNCGCGYFVLADLHHMPFRQEVFDLVWSMGLLEHIPPASLPAALKEMVRVAKENSYVLAIVPTPNSLMAKIGEFSRKFTGHPDFDLRRYWKDPPHYPINVPEILSHFQNSGLKHNTAKMILEEALVETIVVGRK